MEVSGQIHAPAALLPGKKIPLPFSRWVGPRAGLGAMEKGKLTCLYQESNLDSLLLP
jgi:hypothetical protein